MTNELDASRVDFATLGLLLTGVVSACSGELVDATSSGGAGNSGAGTPAASAPGTVEGPAFGAPGLPPTPGTADCMSTSRARLWRLDAEQYEKTLAAALNGRSSAANEELVAPAGLKAPLAPAGGSAETFSTASKGRRVLANDAEDLTKAAVDAAGRLLADPAITACVNGAEPLSICLAAPLSQKAELLFRRPMVAADVAHYLTAADEAVASEGDRREGALVALKALLISPRFVYRTELGTDPGGVSRLDAFEIADALSYSLTDGPPDQGLWQDALSGALLQPAVIEGQVARLMAAADKKAPVRKFVRELFEYKHVPSKPDEFHRPDLLTQEVELFTEHVLRTSAHKDFFKALLTSRDGFLSPATAESYNASMTGADATPQAFTFTGERQGVLGHPAWLSTHAAPDPGEPETVISRGKMVFERLLCGEVPDAPVGIILEVPKRDDQTTRDRLKIHREDPTCSACHRLMDGLGLGFEGFDDYGRLRDTEAGRPVDRTGELFGVGAEDGNYNGLEGLVSKLLASETFSKCMTHQAFGFFMGRDPAPGDACTVQGAQARYLASGGDLAAMTQAFFTSNAFLYRTH